MTSDDKPYEVDAEASPAALKSSFRQWLIEAQTTLLIPIVITAEMLDYIEFAFVGCSPTLTGWIGDRNGSGEMLIEAKYNDIWDGLCWLDGVCPVRRPGGWVCATCESEGHPVLFKAADAIWRDHLFDRLRTWVNETLAPATHIAFHNNDGAQWVTLRQVEHAAYILPVRV